MKKHKRVGQILIEKDLLCEEELESVLYHGELFNARVGDSACQLGYITETDKAKVLSEHVSIPFVDLKHVDVSTKVLNMIPASFCMQNKIVCYKKEFGKIFVALLDPIDSKVLDEIKLLLGDGIIKTVCSKEGLDFIFNKYFKQGSVSAVASYESAKKYLKMVCVDAVTCGANQVHIESLSGKLKVRYKIDGALSCGKKFSYDMYEMLFDFIKNKNIGFEKFILNINGKNEEVILHNIFSDVANSLIIKIFRSEDLNRFSLDEHYLKAVSKSRGIVFALSGFEEGLSTTLYSTVNYLKNISMKMLIISDVKQYNIADVAHIYFSDIKEDFKQSFDEICRQQYDVIMFDDIKDYAIIDFMLKYKGYYKLLLLGMHEMSSAEFFRRLSREVTCKDDLIKIKGVLWQDLVRGCKDEKISANFNFIDFTDRSFSSR